MQDSTFTIDGTKYQLPEGADLTMDEHRVLYGYTHTPADRLDEAGGLNPDLIAGLMHIGLLRETSLTDREIRELIGMQKFTDLLNGIEMEDDEASPPESQPESDGSDSDSSDSSGDASTTTSEDPRVPGEPAPASGVGDSATGATSAQIRSVA